MRISLLAGLIVLPVVALAQDIREERVSFEPGTSGTVIEGSITGNEIVDYMLSAQSGQRMGIDFEPDNPSTYFNLLPDDDPSAIHIGSIAGNSYDGMLKRDGDYRIRVYLIRAAARRGETGDYRLSVSITGDSAAVIRDDFADGLSGGPDYWQVANLGEGSALNLRSAPGTESEVVGQLHSRDVVENGGCRMSGEDRWCSVKTSAGQAGWVSGAYLTEAMAPGADTASGTIPCAMAPSQPYSQCGFRVSRGTGGTASVWVVRPEGGERHFDFREGELVGSDPGLSFRQDRAGDLSTITIDARERYQMPDALIYGG